MKKQFMMLAAIGVAACCFCACNIPGDSDYDALNAMLDASYSQISITVSDKFDENTSLKSEYIVKYSDSTVTVEYSVEQFAEISLDNPVPDVKTMLKGEAVIKDGAITFEGDVVDITADITKQPFTFKKNYFKNIYLTNDYIKAEVKDTSAFLGSDINCSNMSMWATFFDVFYRMEISYTSESGNEVQYIYVFKI